MTHLHALWNDLWPNTVAPSLWTLLAVGAAHWRQHRQARKATRIAADLYRHHTGRAHPDAPAPDRGSEAT